MVGVACLKSHFITSTTIAVMAAVELSVCKLYVGLCPDLPSSNLEEISQTVPLPGFPLPQVEFSGVRLSSIHSSLKRRGFVLSVSQLL